MLFTVIMNRSKIYSFGGSILLFIWAVVLSDSSEKKEAFSETAKIAIRDIGDRLLLANKDSVSLVLPVTALGKSKYRLSFEKHLILDPDSIVTIVQRSFKKAALPKYYRVEVKQCKGGEVAYSYEIKGTKENSIIPCKERFLPKDCYHIEFRFTRMSATFFNQQTLIYFLIFTGLVLLLLTIFKKKKINALKEKNGHYIPIGSFHFYEEQNKLVKEAEEIHLSRKECELLAIFVARPNQLITREELNKKVWEDNGVIVGRSLDTYVSKLRKKLTTDTSIKLTNVHGVGYILEVNL